MLHERRAAAPLLLGARRPPLSIDISCPHGAQQQTRRTLLLRSNNGTDGRTDGRTPDRYIDPAQHTVVSANNALHCRQRTEPRPERTYTEQFEKFGRAVFTARCYASAVLAMVCLSVRPSVCPYQVGVLLKRLNVGSHKQHHTIVQGL